MVSLQNAAYWLHFFKQILAFSSSFPKQAPGCLSAGGMKV